MTSAPPPEAHLPFTDRQRATSFGEHAARYDRVQPSYPRELADAVLTGLTDARVVDAGIGTGLSSLPFKDAGADVLGVDADPRMAAFAINRGIPVEISMFEQWNAGDRRFDAVISGQAWHWIDPVGGAIQAARVLRPGGRVAMFWNEGQPEPAMATVFADVYRSVDTGLPSVPYSTPAPASASGASESSISTAIEGLRTASAFAEPTRKRFDWEAQVSRDDWLERVPLIRGHDRIPAERLAELLSGLGTAIDDHGGSFTMRYATLAVLAEVAATR